MAISNKSEANIEKLLAFVKEEGRTPSKLEEPGLERWLRYQRQKWREGIRCWPIHEALEKEGYESLLYSAGREEVSRLVVRQVCSYVRSYGEDPKPGDPLYTFLQRKRSGAYHIYPADLEECSKMGVPNLLEKPERLRTT